MKSVYTNDGMDKNEEGKEAGKKDDHFNNNILTEGSYKCPKRTFFSVKTIHFIT